MEGGDLVKVNFRLSQRQLEAIKKLVEEGRYSSISEFVREAIEIMISEYRKKIEIE